ncbi:hypothetical protein BLNAU_1327 [Blattamonas nauphoetae]|uniref:Cation/H+ exchanger domain-containing protein n=1 Tax=Blattamonas nauphoetae TaxID=2049346 RepID=A0ABQ9XVY6_9EUKA|nr:hypothetical protein BLNAU_9338 [Blattamonas nauphoetae]KAK2963760.1 hypothetical protein BLNAU_1327 [Blattamonas nauphoetae]
MFDTDGVLIFVDSALNEIIFLVSLPLLQVITQETKEFTPRFAQTALFIIALVTMPLFIPLNFLEDPKQLALPSFKLSTNDSLLTKYNLMQLLITILDRFIDMCFDLKHTIPLILHLVLLVQPHFLSRLGYADRMRWRECTSGYQREDPQQGNKRISPGHHSERHSSLTFLTRKNSFILVNQHRFHHHREHFNDVHVPLQFSVRTNASGIG